MANRIKQHREQKGLSQTELACLVGVAQGCLSRVENGKLHPWPRLRQGLCKALKCSEDVLFPIQECGNGN